MGRSTLVLALLGTALEAETEKNLVERRLAEQNGSSFFC